MPQKPPNILWVMADDHAANAVSAYRSRLAEVFPTPNIDRLGLEGARFDAAFCTNAICTPSRAVILTGQHGHRTGVRTLSDGLDPSVTTFPQLLHDAGYETALFGKWHLHREPRGFDHYEVLPCHGTYWNPRFLATGFDWSRYTLEGAEQLGIPEEGHVTDLITAKSLAWLAGRRPERPWLLLCHHKAPHDDFEYQPRFAHLLDEVTIPAPESLWEDRSHRSEGSRFYGSSVSERNPTRNAVHRMSQWDYPTGRLDVRDLDAAGRARAAYAKYLSDYLRTAEGLDDSVGRLLDHLDQTGLSGDTVVVYTSDQGMFLGEHDYIDKRWIFDESLRLPLFVRHPPTVAPGTVVEEVVSNLDFAPTLLDLAGVPIPPSMQGRSLRPLLSGAGGPWDDEIYYRYWMHLTDHDVPAHLGIRSRRYKLICFYGLPLDATDAVPEPTPAGWELYDLECDPYETRNVFGEPEYREVAGQLRNRLTALRSRYGDEDERFPEVAARMRHAWEAGWGTPAGTVRADGGIGA